MRSLMPHDARIGQVISVPLAIAAVGVTTGSIPDLGSTEGKTATAGYAFVFLNFARAIV